MLASGYNYPFSPWQANPQQTAPDSFYLLWLLGTTPGSM